MAHDPDPRTETSVGSDVFISYAREDQAFVRRLTEALAARGKKAWVDWADIPPTAEWMAEISAAIDATDTYPVVLSPYFAASKVCAAELDTALQANKRIVPVLAREVDETQLPDAVAKLNWVTFTDGLEPAIAKLVEALDTDLGSVKAHTKLLVRAREWEESNRDGAKLLRGADLQRAESWLAATGGGADAAPDELCRGLAPRRVATAARRGGRGEGGPCPRARPRRGGHHPAARGRLAARTGDRAARSRPLRRPRVGGAAREAVG